LTSNGSGADPTFQPCGTGGGANVALSNLSGVAINASLVPDTAGTKDLGVTAIPWRDIFLSGASGTPGTNRFRITGTSTGGLRTVTLPNGDSVTVVPDSGAASNFLTGISAAGVIGKAQPAFSDLSGSAAAAQVPNLEGLNGTLTLVKGGTNQTAWTAARCVRVNTGGTGLEAAGADCAAAGTTNRPILFSEGAVVTAGSPTTLTFDNTSVIQFPSGADSEINTWFRVPPGAMVANDILLMLNFAPNAAPGVTNNQVKLKTTARVNNSSASQTTGDTLTLANNTNWASYTATVNLIAGSTYAVGDFIQMRILRDTTVANNAAVGFNVSKIEFQYVSSQ